MLEKGLYSFEKTTFCHSKEWATSPEPAKAAMFCCSVEGPVEMVRSIAISDSAVNQEGSKDS
jgi:hypothetical protein